MREATFKILTVNELDAMATEALGRVYESVAENFLSAGELMMHENASGTSDYHLERAEMYINKAKYIGISFATVIEYLVSRGILQPGNYLLES
jgi:hypothetical protein